MATSDIHAPHAIVIGSGFGGLAAAVRLLARGYRVTVLERRDAPGGRAYVYRKEGFTFDGGPTVITAPFLFEELWELSGRKLSEDVEMLPVYPFYRIRFHDGVTFDYSGDADLMRQEILRLAPGDQKGYQDFLDMAERIFRVGFEKLADVPFDGWIDMLKIVPEMVKLESYRSVYGLVSKYVKNDRLRQILSFHPLLVGGNPFVTTSIYTLIAFLERKWGVWFPKGGTSTLVYGLVDRIRAMGGELKLNTEVKQIVVENGRARGVLLADGTRVESDIVVSNADSAWTYRYLVPESNRKRWTNEKIDAARYSMSLFVWYFGTRKKYEDVAHHTILLGPRYRELLDDIFDNKVLAEDFSLYLHRPTATDPSLAPAGCDTFYVLSPVPHLDSGIDWSRESEPYRRKIEQFLSSTLLNGLENELAVSHLLTPQDFRSVLLSHKGAAFGIEPILTQSAYFRPHNRSEEVDGLYLVGAGTHPGAGVPGVITSAKILDRVVPDPNN
jgi:phytoene desaturase